MPVTIPNLRDVGGLPALDGSVVRHGRLLRSALPLADDVVPDHISWPPVVVIDLRSPVEGSQDHPFTGLGPRLVNLPLMQSLRPGWMSDSTLADLYALVLDDAPHLLVRVVREVATADGAALVHCAAGKDRTGISVALVLRLLGVPDEHVESDYLRSRESLGEINARLRGDAAAHPVNPTFLGVEPAALHVALERWSTHPGGVSGWFESAGGTAADVQRLRETMLA